jgi:uncharacterized protein (TIGR02265 family)
MQPSQAALDLIAPHCDIVSRLEAVPPSAAGRGVFFRIIERELERRGLLAPYHELFPAKNRWSISYHPLSDFLVRLACAGALISSPERLHEGMKELARTNSVFFAKSLLGRTLIRLLSRDPVRLSEQALAARRQSFNYGHWELIRHGETELEMVYRNEYIWLESYVAGAAQGTFESCGITPILETKLVDKFNGSTFISW